MFSDAELLTMHRRMLVIRGFEERVGRETGMPVRLADDPLHCVAAGAGQSLEELDALSSSSSRR